MHLIAWKVKCRGSFHKQEPMHNFDPNNHPNLCIVQILGSLELVSIGIREIFCGIRLQVCLTYCPKWFSVDLTRPDL